MLLFYGLSNNKLKFLNFFFSMVLLYLFFFVINLVSFNWNWVVLDVMCLYVIKFVNFFVFLNDIDII